ncbi:IL-1 receptor antagonist [Deerpox virus W-848-83]|uniref:Interleukin-1 receptor antagonist protein n=1 Tax=Deerpox virus (strain Mule deer/United States/W-848-83/1983) TaxID=305674 RepID=Q08FU8_DPV83|nr:IL-1 receptor antagonist [Deerpox virus W-848-83]ABI99209.1 IL-1 receptor antagonist [Deerpox virus W-848-83]
MKKLILLLVLYINIFNSKAAGMFMYSIWDVNQKIFYLRNNQLVAGNIQDNSLAEKITVKLNDGNSMFLGVKNGEKSLECTKHGDKVTLSLSDKKTNSLDENQDKRFAFIRSDNGLTSTFESVAFPGWFLCTSSGDGIEPVGLTYKGDKDDNDDDKNNIYFYFEED